MMDFEYDKRRIFNDLVFNEIIRDYQLNSISKVLDIGCGDGYLLSKFLKAQQEINLYCSEIQLSNIYNAKSIKPFNLNNYKNFPSYFDIITAIDVIYLFPPTSLSLFYECINYTLSPRGTCYIVLGIYKESLGEKIFFEELKSINYFSYSLDELVELFSQTFKVFLKKFNFNSSFGIYPAKKKNIKNFLDYLYNDKLLIKLRKLGP